MILTQEQWHYGYSQIVKDCRECNLPVLLCVSPSSVDAVCAARMWAYWLRADGISYELLAAAPHWGTVQQRLSTVGAGTGSSSSPYGAVVLFNLGATVNLTKLFEQAACRIFVTDAQRPVHLANIYAPGDHVVVFWDPVNGDPQDLPSDGDNLSGNESSSSEEEDDDEDDDEDSSNDEEDDREREFGQEDDENEGEQEIMDDDDDDDNSESRTHHQHQKNLQRDENPAQEDEDDDSYDGEDEMDGRMNEKKNKPSKRARFSGPLNTTAATVDTEATATMEHGSSDDENEEQDADAESNSPTQLDETQTTVATAPTQQGTASNLPPLTPREVYRQRRQRLRQYYASGTSYGSPASYLAWELAASSRFGTQADLLWLAMTGVSGSYLYHQLDRTGYLTLALPLREACERLFPNDLYTRVAHQTVYAEHLTSSSGNNNNNDGGTMGTATRTKLTVSDNGRILSETDFRFFLLRHSNLYQAMALSDYVATHLQLTTAAGRLKLQEWLATMGFSLQEARQPFALMKPALRRRLQERVRQTAPEYELDELEYTSFFRVTGFQSLLSAADTAHAVAALLCSCGTRQAGSNNEDDVDDDGKQQQQAFQRAFDALNYQDSTGNNNMATLVNGNVLSTAATTGLAGGLRLANILQQAIQSAAASLMDRRAITRLSHFRYAYINTGGKESKTFTANHNHQDWFCQPMVLVRLAHYLYDWHRASNQWTGVKARPLLLCAQNSRNDTYIVVGQAYPEHAGSLAENTLGQYFRLAAETLNKAQAAGGGGGGGDNGVDDDGQHGKNIEQQKLKATVRLDGSFDSHVVQVASSHVQRFIEQLHYLMDSL